MESSPTPPASAVYAGPPLHPWLQSDAPLGRSRPIMGTAEPVEASLMHQFGPSGAGGCSHGWSAAELVGIRGSFYFFPILLRRGRGSVCARVRSLQHFLVPLNALSEHLAPPITQLLDSHIDQM